MALTILYFAWLREAIGVGEEQVDPPAGIATVADLADWLERRGGGYAVLGDRGRLRAAIDGTHAPLDAAIGRAGEVSFFPPVTGG